MFKRAARDSVGNQPKANQANIELFFLLNVRETNSQ
jgi:hypothetical protein